MEKGDNLVDPTLVMMSDDIEGFFTNVDVDAAIMAHERIIQLYMAQYAKKEKSGETKISSDCKKFQQDLRSNRKICKTRPGTLQYLEISWKI